MDSPVRLANTHAHVRRGALPGALGNKHVDTWLWKRKPEAPGELGTVNTFGSPARGLRATRIPETSLGHEVIGCMSLAMAKGTDIKWEDTEKVLQNIR